MLACKKVNVGFTYSPVNPRAGETVYFSNQSSSGEEWSWSYGDGATSVVKSPSHVYKQPGTYRITLQVDKKKKQTATKQITVYDTVPTFSCDAEEFVIYDDYTFNAIVYNPYNYDVTYEWSLPDGDDYAVVTDTTAKRMNKSALHLYFTRPMEGAKVALRVVVNGIETKIEHRYTIQDKATHAVLMRTAETDYRQRIFGDRAEQYRPTIDTLPLYNEQDIAQTYNKIDFTIASLSSMFPGIKGFHIASRKIYYRADGLWVANLDGSYKVQIDADECDAMTLDTQANRIYWANAKGVWYLPFIGSDNNKYITEPAQLNTLPGVKKLAVDYEKK